jgi:HTH-type transcriptional regulator / antitoxin HigA
MNMKYWKLIKRFPLRPIRTDEELDVASEIFSELGMKGDSLSQDENDYLDILRQQIMDYEAKSPAIQAMIAEARSIPPQRILQSIIEENGLSQSQLAREIGCHQEHLSAFLSGKRGLSKINAVKLGKRFCVSADLFLPRINEKVAG